MRPVRRVAPWLWPAATGVVVAAVWESAWQAELLDPLFMSGPSTIAAALARLIRTGEILGHLAITLYSATLGFLGAIIVGVPAGIFYALSPRVQRVAAPYLAALNATPRVALIPLFTVWFGLGLTTRAVMVAISAFFPLFFNVTEGVRTLDPALDRAARAYGCTRLEQLRHIVLPHTLPYAFIGARLAVGRGLIVIIVAEIFVGSLGGIGYYIINAGQNFHSAEIFASAILLAITGLALTHGVGWLGKRLCPWHQEVAL